MLDSTKSYSGLIAVAFWGTNAVRLLKPVTGLEDTKTNISPPTLPSLPRSILLHNFGFGTSSKGADYRPFVIAGLADGTIACFAIKDDELRDLKMFPLGTAPVSLTSCSVDGKRAVFANGSLSSVLYWDKQRLRQSHVMVKVSCSLSTTSLSARSFCHAGCRCWCELQLHGIR